MAIRSVIHTNQQSIQRVLGAGAPVLLVFWKRDVVPMRQLDPVLARLAERYAGRALVAKVDVEAEAALARRYEVTQVPALFFVKQGNVEGKGVGAVSEDALAGWLDYLIQGGLRPAAPSGPAVEIQATVEPTYTNGQAGHGRGQPRPAEDGKPVTATDTNFQQIINSDKPVLVDFWAPWCGPCRMVAPAVEQLAQEFQGRALVAKLNVDENPMTANQYGIRGIPALYIYKQGQVVDQIVGAQPATVLRQRLARHV